MQNGFRKLQGLMLGITGVVVILSFYLQYIEALRPCPLCLMQRSMMCLIFLSALIGVFVVKRALLVFELLFVAGGAFFASRQLWLQSLPPTDTGMCLPGVDVLIDKLPWHEVLHVFVWGAKTSCAEVSWTFLSFSMAAWSLLYFSLIGILSVFLGIKYVRNERV